MAVYSLNKPINFAWFGDNQYVTIIESLLSNVSNPEEMITFVDLEKNLHCSRFINMADKRYLNPLLYAAEKGASKISKLLCESGPRFWYLDFCIHLFAMDRLSNLKQESPDLFDMRRSGGVANIRHMLGRIGQSENFQKQDCLKLQRADIVPSSLEQVFPNGIYEFLEEYPSKHDAFIDFLFEYGCAPTAQDFCDLCAAMSSEELKPNAKRFLDLALKTAFWTERSFNSRDKDGNSIIHIILTLQDFSANPQRYLGALLKKQGNILESVNSRHQTVLVQSMLMKKPAFTTEFLRVLIESGSRLDVDYGKAEDLKFSGKEWSLLNGSPIMVAMFHSIGEDYLPRLKLLLENVKRRHQFSEQLRRRFNCGLTLFEAAILQNRKDVWNILVDALSDECSDVSPHALVRSPNELFNFMKEHGYHRFPAIFFFDVIDEQSLTQFVKTYEEIHLKSCFNAALEIDRKCNAELLKRLHQLGATIRHPAHPLLYLLHVCLAIDQKKGIIRDAKKPVFDAFMGGFDISDIDYEDDKGHTCLDVECNSQSPSLVVVRYLCDDLEASKVQAALILLEKNLPVTEEKLHIKNYLRQYLQCHPKRAKLLDRATASPVSSQQSTTSSPRKSPCTIPSDLGLASPELSGKSAGSLKQSQTDDTLFSPAKRARVKEVASLFDDPEVLRDDTEKNQSGFVYLMKDDLNHFKIGSSTDVQRRYLELRTANITLKLLEYVPVTKRYTVEFKMHEHYKRRHKHVDLEWFKEIDTVDFVEQVKHFNEEG